MLFNCGFGEDPWDLDSKEIKPVNHKEIIGKDPDAGKGWGQEETGAKEDEVLEWLHQLSGHESEQIQEIMKDREAWQAAVHGAVKRRTRFRD